MRLGPADVKRSVGSIPDRILRTLRVDDDQFTFYTTESEVIDVIARDLPFDDHGQLGQHLCQLEAAVVFLLRDWGNWPTAAETVPRSRRRFEFGSDRLLPQPRAQLSV